MFEVAIHRTLRTSFVLILAAGCGALAGCQGTTGSVTGKVNYRNVPLKGGNIAFASAVGGQSYSFPIAEDGTYNAPAMLVGSYKICVETASLRPNPNAMAQKFAVKSQNMSDIPTGGSNPGLANKNASRYVQIPDLYAKPDTTDITYEVKSGSQTYDIELK